MKSFFLAVSLLLIVGGTAARLATRWHEEAADHRLVILADWSEIQGAASRFGLTDQQLLERLAGAGANALLVGPATVQDYLWQNMTFKNRALAEAVLRQLEDRGVAGVALHGSGQKFVLTNSVKNWELLKDIELGFNPELLGMAKQAGLHLVLRVNNNPWLTKEKQFEDLSEIASANQELGFLFNTDEMPGGADTASSWVSFLESQEDFSLLFEFHPTKSALRIAARSPQTTFRAHTIPSLERKDLTADQEMSRWHRAIQERACRFLLFHMAPDDSLASFLETVSSSTQDFIRSGWSVRWPAPRPAWKYPSFAERFFGPLLALTFAILVPVGALRLNRTGTPFKSYGAIFGITLAGACVMAALADNPLSRLEIVPFRGVKLAFALAWLGSFLVLYTGKEIREALSHYIRRVDALVAFVVAAVAAYMLLRSGNAGSGWQAGWEQSVRDRLEFIFVARPRFKEFAIGYPLLLLGLYTDGRSSSFWRDGRFWIGVGMIGPISMVNTFCHLHSPLYLAFWRSLNGFILGTLVGMALLRLKKWQA